MGWHSGAAESVDSKCRRAGEGSRAAPEPLSQVGMPLKETENSYCEEGRVTTVTHK